MAYHCIENEETNNEGNPKNKVEGLEYKEKTYCLKVQVYKLLISGFYT